MAISPEYHESGVQMTSLKPESTIVNAIACVIVVLLLSSDTAAQSSCDYGYTYQTYESLPFIPGTYNCVPSPPYALLCWVKTSACMPANAAEETTCSSCARATAGHPINLANGNTFNSRELAVA
jgi:hypothetical protein